MSRCSCFVTCLLVGARFAARPPSTANPGRIAACGSIQKTTTPNAYTSSPSLHLDKVAPVARHSGALPFGLKRFVATSASVPALSSPAAASTKMRAIRVFQPGPADCMVLGGDVPVPGPLGPTDVLVRNAHIGVNFIDTYHRTGLYPLPTPFTPGVEGAGVVEAVGSDVTSLSVGDRVAYVTRPPGGSYAELVVVPASKAAVVAEGMAMDVAAASMIQGMTAVSLVTQAYSVQAGDVVLVHAAAGGTGSLVVQAAAAAAGAHVIGSVSIREKEQVARQAGCRDVINYSHQDVVAEVMRITAGRGVRAVYDGVGRATFDASLACLDKLGWMISFGNASGKVPELDILKLSRNNVRLMRPALWDFIATPEEFAALSGRTLGMVTSGALRVHVHATLPLEQAAEAHKLLESRGTVGKLLLKP